MQLANLSRTALIVCASATSALAQLVPGELIVVGQGNPLSVPVMYSYVPGSGVTSLTVSGLSNRITSACYDPASNGIFAGVGGSVFSVSFSGTTATASLLCATPGHAENWTLFIGHNGRPVATRPSGRMYECSAGGAVDLFPAPPWTSMQAASYDPITGRYYAITTDGSGPAIYVIDPTGPTFTRIASPVATSSIQDLFADGSGGVYLSNSSTTANQGGLWHVDSAGNGVLLVDRVLTGATHICRMAWSPTCPLKFYSWGCLTGPDDDVDTLDAFLPGNFALLTALPNFGGTNGGIWDVVEVPGGSQGSAFAYGSGCVDSGSVVLSLVGDGCHERGLSTGLNLATGVAGPTFLTIGGSNSNWFGLPLPFPLAGLGGGSCSLLASEEVVLGPLANGGTGVSIKFGIPRDPLITGAQIYFQGLMIDFPPGNTLGVVTSNGVLITIG